MNRGGPNAKLGILVIAVAACFGIATRAAQDAPASPGSVAQRAAAIQLARRW